MKRLLIIILYSVACFSGTAQTKLAEDYRKKVVKCGGMDSILNRKGSWRKISDDLAFPDKTFPRSQYKFANARIDSIHLFLKNTFRDLSGVEPHWYRGIRGNAYFPGGPVPYKYTSYFLEYYCNENLKKILLGDETNNWVSVFVNTLNGFLESVDTLDINNDGKVKMIFRLPPKIGAVKGLDVFKLKSTDTREARAIIIGRHGLVPWRSLTQKQYLTGLKNQYEKRLKTSRDRSGFQRDYLVKLKFIKDYLSSTNEETLQKPAIIDSKAGIWGFKGKFGEDGEGGFRLVLSVTSDKYFDKSLPRFVPQLIQLYWSYGPSPVGQNIKNQLEQTLPVEKLKAMIDK